MTAGSNTEVATRSASNRAFDVDRLRSDFLALDQTIKGHPLVYLDNAASTQKPQQVVEALSRFYSHDYANIHRGVHELSERATKAYEGARLKVQKFVGAASEREVVFVRGTTEGINLVAATYGRANVGEGDEVLITTMEHHSNIVPWQMLCEEKSAVLKVVPINDRGELEMDELQEAPRTAKTKIVAVGHVSNALGTINPIRADHRARARTRAFPFSSMVLKRRRTWPSTCRSSIAISTRSPHTRCSGPPGIGALYAKESLLEKMPPYQGGGDMISYVSLSKKRPTTGSRSDSKRARPISPARWVFGAAVDYLERRRDGGDRRLRGRASRLRHATLSATCLAFASSARRAHKASVLSFVLDGIHPHDIGTILDQAGYRGSHRTPLRPAGDGSLRRSRDRAGIARVLQHARGHRPPRERAPDGARGVQLMVGADLRELYQEVILDHSKRPRNFGELDAPTHDAKGHNPLCGDRLELYLAVADGVIQDVSFKGAGCAISTASASMMTEALEGKTEAEAEAMFGAFHDVVTGSSDDAADAEALGKLAVFAGVRDYPVRVKCATLAWHTMKAALANEDDAISTE